MNNTRRKEIGKIISDLQSLSQAIEIIKDDEQTYQENIPENLQYTSDQWECSEEAICALECATNSIEELMMNLEDAAL